MCLPIYFQSLTSFLPSISVVSYFIYIYRYILYNLIYGLNFSINIPKRFHFLFDLVQKYIYSIIMIYCCKKYYTCRHLKLTSIGNRHGGLTGVYIYTNCQPRTDQYNYFEGYNYVHIVKLFTKYPCMCRKIT